MINPFLNQTADDFSISDDAYIRWFLAEHKLLAAFSAGPFSKPTFQCRRFFSHISYWLVICRYDGHANPFENGYAIQCLSKAIYSRTDFDSFFEHTYRFHSIDSGDKQIFKLKPESN